MTGVHNHVISALYRPSMRRVAVHRSPEAVTIEVEGDLDLVTAHDLRRAVSAVLQGGPGDIVLDLSRVTSADDYGASALMWCSEQALAAGRLLSWSSCSQPLGRDLRAVIATRRGLPSAS
jgi:anti-anti-sigma factor